MTENESKVTVDETDHEESKITPPDTQKKETRIGRLTGWSFKELNWTLENFKEGVLSNSYVNNFHSISKEVRFAFFGSGSLSYFELRLRRNKSSIVLFIIYYYKNVGFGAKHRHASLSYEVGILDRYGAVLKPIKGKVEDLPSSYCCGGSLEKRIGLITNAASYKKIQHSLEPNKLTINMKLFVTEFDCLKVKRDSENSVNLLTSQFENLFNNEKFSDFKIETVDGNTIPVHRNILSVRSPVFDTMFQCHMKEKSDNKVTIDDIDEKALMECLRFIYCGKIEIVDGMVEQLLYAAHKYEIDDLKPLLVHPIVKNLDHSNVVHNLGVAELYNEKNLKNICISCITSSYNDVKNLKDWESIPAKLYKEILDQALLQKSIKVEEIKSALPLPQAPQQVARRNAVLHENIENMVPRGVPVGFAIAH